MPQIFIGATHVGGCDELYALERRRQARSAARRRGIARRPADRHEQRSSRPSRVGLVQMRSGARPPANLDAAVRLIGEAKSGRRRLRAHARDDQHHGDQARAAVRRDRAGGETTLALATFRELARKLGIYLHVGSLADQALARQGGQPLVPDRSARARSSRATTRSTCSTSISPAARAIASRAAYRPGELAVRRRPAVGPARADDLLRSALSRRSIARWRRPAASFIAIPSAFTKQTGEAHWHVLDARARDRERLLRVRGRAGRQARERPRDVRPFAGRRSVGPHPRRRRHRAGRRDGQDRSGRGRRRARASPRCSTGGASRSSSRWRSRRHLHAVGGAR